MADSECFPTQISLLEASIAPAVSAAVDRLSASEEDERGAVFTRREIVDFILDLIEYTPDNPLHKMRLLEPAFGNGDFLLPAVERLLKAYRKHSKVHSEVVSALKEAVRAVELHRATFKATRRKLKALLKRNGIDDKQAQAIISAWLIQGDFLLETMDGDFTHIIGNPPYIRQELIPNALMNEYRSRFRTIYDRADIYVPFIEKSLSHLAEKGSLGFICSDRWMKNRYGGPLRRLVAERFRLRFYIDMVDTPAFHSDVMAYPAITILQNDKPGATRVAHRPQVDRETLSQLARTMLNGDQASNGAMKELSGVTQGAEPWVLESQDQLAVVRRLEATFPTLEEASCKVGIGVATGADKVFIGPIDELNVEPSRKLPLVMTRDILTGSVEWRGCGVINPFDDDGGLVSLSKYPKLAAYLNEYGVEIRKRHVSKRNPEGWYRTIDRIYPALAKQPKLLIPDIKGEPNIVYEDGRLYPHHNLYFIVSDEWDLKALQAVLKSGIARLFVSIYSTKMRGGYLRYQAQYLRRIRVPRWSAVAQDVKAALISAAAAGNTAACNSAVYKMYGLTKNERAAIGDNGE